MDFALTHIREESVTTKSNIRRIPESTTSPSNKKEELDHMVIQAANQAAMDLFLGPQDEKTKNDCLQMIDSKLYPERLLPQTDTIQPNQLVVIMESFDNLNFVYATPKAIFSNRNGHFHHDDFIGKPFGCKIRSRSHRGYGFVYLLKPTPELWTRSLHHRTQIVHELDASMIVYYLHLRPNAVVVESGTGSGAMSHAFLRTIAPCGHLHTYEFNQVRADWARDEFSKHGLSHLVQVHHKDVCGKQEERGGFDRPGQSVDAVFLDLPEPWLAVPHAAYCLKPGARIASYSPCVEQSQRTIAALRQCGFHSIQTMEFRLREHYVDEVEYEPPPKEKRPRLETHNPLLPVAAAQHMSGGEDTGAEADNEKSEADTEGDVESQTTQGTHEEAEVPVVPSPAVAPAASAAVVSSPPAVNGKRTKKMLVARPFVSMRGHTAFLTFASAGNRAQPDPNATETAASTSDGNEANVTAKVALK